MPKVMRSTVCSSAALAAAAFIVAGCGEKDVIAVVGSSKVRRSDLVEAHGATTAAATRKRLDVILPRAILAEGARRAGIAQEDPAVEARIRAAEREILAQAYLDRETRAATEEAALRKLYEAKKGSLARKQLHVRHIMIRRPAAGDNEAHHDAQRRINGIYAELVGGADFDSLARERSDDAVSGKKGGDLGPLLEGQVDAAFFAAAAALRKGESSKPVESALGFHIAQAVEEPAIATPTFEEVRGRLASEARGEAQAKLLEKLRSEMTVRVHEDRLAAEK